MPDVKIFGEHDDRTREQMARCMQYGSVVGGVLCADGHLGYAQPVGGVIAYEDHISVSGVGFDIACGNLAVKLDVPKRAIEDCVVDTVHNHHNFAWRERHGERDLWVVRKGATPGFPGQRGFVGGSMADDAVILCGIESEAVAASFYSTVHGAGRVMSRTEARGRLVKDPATGKKLRQPGRVQHDAMQAWLREKGVHLLGGDVDEAPQAYRRLPDVLVHHSGTVKIEHILRPFAVLMAGSDVFDPFKD